MMTQGSLHLRAVDRSGRSLSLPSTAIRAKRFDGHAIERSSGHMTCPAGDQ